MSITMRLKPTTRRSRRAVLIGVVAVAMVGTAVLLGPARSVFADTTSDEVTNAPATRHVTDSEGEKVGKLDHEKIVKRATPVLMPDNVPLPKDLRSGRADGPALSHPGAVPRRLSPPPAAAPDSP